jgi:Transposase DDE domain
LQDQFAPFFERKRKGRLIASSPRHRFETYLNKVFDFSSQVEALPDGRIFPWHPGKKIFDAVFLGAACQYPALHRIETACQRGGVLSKRIGALSEDAMGYALERYDSQEVFRLGCRVARQLKRNGVFRSSWSRGLVVAAVDGIEICSSFARFCDHCMERKVTHVVDGKSREEIQYYHRICAVSVVSSAFPIPLGIRFQKKGEDEVSGSLELLRELDEQLGTQFLDVLVADALYLQTPFVQAIEGLGLDWVINLKENQPELLAESERVISTLAAEKMDDHPELELCHAPEIYWPAADRSVRVVKTIRQQPVNRVRVERDEEGKKSAVKETVVQPATNFYASNLELGSIPPMFIHQLGRSRWIIDTTVFQTMTTDAHLKRPSVHQGSAKALVVLTMIRVLAYTLTVVFFHRQVRSHFRKCSLGFCDLAQKLANWFLVPQADSS